MTLHKDIEDQRMRYKRIQAMGERAQSRLPDLRKIIADLKKELERLPKRIAELEAEEAACLKQIELAAAKHADSAEFSEKITLAEKLADKLKRLQAERNRLDKEIKATVDQL